MSEEVLSLVLGAVAVFYGMMWAMMIAGEAGKATSVVFPFRFFVWTKGDGSRRTHAGTYTAFYAAFTHYTEWLVGDEMADKVAADDQTIDARPVSDDEPVNPFLSPHDVADIFL